MVKKSDLKKLNSIIQEGNSLKNEREYNKAVEKYLEAIVFVESRVKDEVDKKEEINNIKSQIDQLYSIEILDLLDEGNSFVEKREFNKAFDTFEDAIRIADKIADSNLRKSENDDIYFEIAQSKLKESIEKALNIKKDERFDNSINLFKDTLIEAENLYADEPNHEIIQKIKNEVNQTYLIQVKLLEDQGNNMEEEGDIDEAIEIFKNALDITGKFYESNLKTTEMGNVKYNVNHLYSLKSKPFVDKGTELYEQNNFESAVKEFEKALEITQLMYESDYKQKEIQRIKAISSEALNPVYAERIKPILDKGKELIIKENYEMDINIVNEAIELFSKALDIAEKMVDSELKTKRVAEITDLINNTCRARINLLKDNSVRKLAQRDFDNGINEIYAAISVAKKMVVPEESNKELEDLKSTVNKAYSTQIDDVVKEGKKALDSKNYDEALKIFNQALEMTNKMYLTSEMEQEVSKIKALMYQVELKDLVGRGDLAEEQQKFVKELERLNKKMEYAQTIDDTDRRYNEMEKIKHSIDEVHFSEIKLLVEQGVQLAEVKEFNNAYDLFERALKIHDLIESPEYKNKIPIKQNYKTYLINKAKIEIANKAFDTAIQECSKSLELDNAFIEGYYYIGVANIKKESYEIAIESFRKILDMNTEHAETWNMMGYAMEKLNRIDGALASYEKAIGIEEDFADAWFNMGTSYKLQEKYDRAIQSYKRATEIDDKLEVAWLFLGVAYLGKNDYHMAIDAIDKALELKPDLGEDITLLVSDFKDLVKKLQERAELKFINR